MKRTRLAVLLVAVALPALGLNLWMWRGGTAPYSYDVSSFPASLGLWALRSEERLTASELRIIEPDEHLMRRYDAGPTSAVWLYVGFYSGRAGLKNNAHDPEVCYPSQGWDISDTHNVTIPVDGGEELRASFLRARQSSREEYVVYWFQPAYRWPASAGWEEVLRIGDALLGTPQYAFVRVSVPANENGDAREQAESFAKLAVGPIRSVLQNAHREGP